MTGVVNADLDSVIRLRVTGASGVNETIDFVLDTGFSGGLSLPTAMIRRLGLPLSHETVVILADGSEIKCDVYRGSVEWDGRPTLVAVYTTDGDALMGMQLLRGHRIIIDALPGGRVTIAPLP